MSDKMKYGRPGDAPPLFSPREKLIIYQYGGIFSELAIFLRAERARVRVSAKWKPKKKRDELRSEYRIPQDYRGFSAGAMYPPRLD